MLNEFRSSCFSRQQIFTEFKIELFGTLRGLIKKYPEQTKMSQIFLINPTRFENYCHVVRFN